MTEDTETFDEFVEETDDVPTVTTGDLRDGEGLILAFTDSPELFDSDQYGRGFRIDAIFGESDYQFVDDDGQPLEEGDECRLVSWGKRLGRAIRRWASDREDAYLGPAKIKKSGDGMNVDYSVTDAETDPSE